MSAIAITFADFPGGPPRQHRLAGQLSALLRAACLSQPVKTA
jgi:hypothetical protein